MSVIFTTNCFKCSKINTITKRCFLLLLQQNSDSKGFISQDCTEKMQECKKKIVKSLDLQIWISSLNSWFKNKWLEELIHSFIHALTFPMLSVDGQWFCNPTNFCLLVNPCFATAVIVNFSPSSGLKWWRPFLVMFHICYVTLYGNDSNNGIIT